MEKIDFKNKRFFDKIFSIKGKQSDSSKVENLPNWEFIIDAHGNYLNISEEVQSGLGIRPDEFDNQSIFTFSICQSSGEKLYEKFKRKKFPLEEDIDFVSIDNKKVTCNIKLTTFSEEFNSQPTFIGLVQVINIASKNDLDLDEKKKNSPLEISKATIDSPPIIAEDLNLNNSEDYGSFYKEESIDSSKLFITPTEIINNYAQEANHLTDTIGISRLTFSVLDDLFPNYNILIGLLNKEKQIEIPIMRVDGEILYFPEISDFKEILKTILHSEGVIRNKVNFSSQRIFENYFETHRNSTYVGIPIKSGSQSIGAIFIYDYSPGEFLPGDLEVLKKISAIMANAIENAEIYYEMQNALDAIETREKYQYQILQAVKIISGFGTERLQEALEFLGKATNVNRIFFADPVKNTDSLKWMIKNQWYSEEKYNCSHLSQEIPIELLYEHYSRLLEKGYVHVDYENLDSHFSRWLEIRGTKSILFHTVTMNNEDFCLLGFENIYQFRYWKNDEITYLGFISEILSKNLQKELKICELQKNIEKIDNLSRIKKLITGSISIDYLFEIINSEVLNFELDYGLIVSINLSDQNKCESLEVESSYSNSEVIRFNPSFLDVSFINSLAHFELPLFFEDIEFSPLPQLAIQEFQNQNIQSVAILPLLSTEGLFGIILLCFSHQREYPLLERDILLQINPDLSLKIKNHLLFDEIKKVERELSEIDEIKKKFISNITHEFRTPLNSIIGFSKVIMTGIDGPINETQSQDLTAIYNSGQYLLLMINDLLDLSKIKAGKFQLNLSRTNIKILIESIKPQLEDMIKEKLIKLQLDISDYLPEIEVDKVRIQQVIKNLVSNSVKNTDYGTITISAKLRKQTTQVNEIEIMIIDTGKGISKSDQQKLFTPFVQSEDHEKSRSFGSGLGLVISKAIINLHNGDIGLKSSTPGEGSKFYITLPVS